MGFGGNGDFTVNISDMAVYGSKEYGTTTGLCFNIFTMNASSVSFFNYVVYDQGSSIENL